LVRPGAVIAGVIALAVELEVEVRPLPAVAPAVRALRAKRRTPPAERLADRESSRGLDVAVGRGADPGPVAVERHGDRVATISRVAGATGWRDPVDSGGHGH